MKKAERIAQEARDLISSRYNAENDCIPGTPLVTFTDMKALDLLAELADRVAELEEKVGHAQHK